MDRGYYATHSLTLAKHPSETDLRFMLRLLAFALFADEQLSFGKGMSSDEEPDLWQIALHGSIERWIDLGQPNDKRLRRACGKADEVVIINYDQRAADMWWQQEQSKLSRFNNLTVLQAGSESSLQALAAMAARAMQISVTIQDGEIWIADDSASVLVTMSKREG